MCLLECQELFSSSLWLYTGWATCVKKGAKLGGNAFLKVNSTGLGLKQAAGGWRKRRMSWEFSESRLFHHLPDILTLLPSPLGSEEL